MYVSDQRDGIAGRGMADVGVTAGVGFLNHQHWVRPPGSPSIALHTAPPLDLVGSDAPLGVPTSIRVNAWRFAASATLTKSSLREAARHFCEARLLVGSSAEGALAHCTGALTLAVVREAAHKRQGLEKLLGRPPWPLVPMKERYLRIGDEGPTQGLVAACFADLGFKEVPAVTTMLPPVHLEEAHSASWDVLWTLMPQHSQTKKLGRALQLPGFPYEELSPGLLSSVSHDLSHSRQGQVHNHCFPHGSAPGGPKHQLALAWRSLRVWAGVPTGEECLSYHQGRLCFPHTFVAKFGTATNTTTATTATTTTSGAGGDGAGQTWAGYDTADELALARTWLEGGQPLVAKGAMSSGASSAKIVRTPLELDELRVRGQGEFVLQRVVEPLTMDGRRLYYRILLGIASIAPLRAYVRSHGYAIVARRRTADAPSDSDHASSSFISSSASASSCDHTSGVCTPEGEREQLFAHDSGELYRHAAFEAAMVGSRLPSDWLPQVHAAAAGVAPLALHASSLNGSEYQRTLRQVALGGASCFEYLGLDFMFDAQRGGAPVLIDSTMNPAPHLMPPETLRDFLRAAVARDDPPGAAPPTPAGQATQRLEAVARLARQQGLGELSVVDVALLREQLDEETRMAAASVPWLPAFPLASPGDAGASLLRGKLAREDALAAAMASTRRLR